MATSLFLNLPVKELDRSVRFFTALGFSFNPQFTDETATCMIVSDTIYVMLLTEERSRTFIPNELSDARKSTEVLIGLSRETREEVDEIVRRALASGGNTYNEPTDHGFMYIHGFQDPDGHIWEVFHMDPSAVPQG